MNVRLHHLDHAAKHFEIVAFPRLEWMLDKEWDDRPEQIAALAYAVSRSVAVIPSDDSTTEEPLQRVQQLNVALVLHDGEFRKHLASHPHAGMYCNPDMKTSFTVHEACDPFRLER